VITKTKISMKKRDLLRALTIKKNEKMNEFDDPEINNSSPEFKLNRILLKLERFHQYDFSEFKEYSFNASLILRNKVSNGVIILGSNNYKYKVENLNHLDAIVNIIGEYPAKEFEKQVSLHVEEFNEKNCKEVFESIIITNTGHSINCYTKPNENFSSYHYLADVIHRHLWSGDKVLIHCQMGQVRSATLLLFYLRKYFFDDVNDANQFIGLKRENAGAPTVLLSNIETLVKER